MDLEPIPFLDVRFLLDRSEVRAPRMWTAYAVGGVIVAFLVGGYLTGESQLSQDLMRLLASFIMVALVVGLMTYSIMLARGLRREQGQIEEISELVQLRRWAQAAGLLQETLSRPARTHGNRVQALLYLTSVLARYARFEDAIAVQDYLLEHINLDTATAHAVRLGKLMAMLRADHLFDADRAISEMRRSPDGTVSGGLALIELYRDVKTGHPAEAIETFEAKLELMRSQLGHRVADAYVLAAKAYDLLGRDSEAQAAYEKATLLSPLLELARRYPEVDTLGRKYQPAPAPREAA